MPGWTWYYCLQYIDNYFDDKTIIGIKTDFYWLLTDAHLRFRLLLNLVWCVFTALKLYIGDFFCETKWGFNAAVFSIYNDRWVCLMLSVISLSQEFPVSKCFMTKATANALLIMQPCHMRRNKWNRPAVWGNPLNIIEMLLKFLFNS